jgi:hypothetical protein
VAASDRAEAVAAIEQMGMVIVDLDLRSYAPDGSISDIRWSASNPTGLSSAVQDARDGLGVMDRPVLPADWLVVTVAA